MFISYLWKDTSEADNTGYFREEEIDEKTFNEYLSVPSEFGTM